jgi:hypothetical protein
MPLAIITAGGGWRKDFIVVSLPAPGLPARAMRIVLDFPAIPLCGILFY